MQQGIGRIVISHIIIDGYNVMGILHKDMEREREALTNLLIQYRRVSGHEITLVFDGHKNGPGREQSAVRAGLRIIYSALSERADDVIKKIITETKREWIVVTSDRDIVSHAWAVDSIPIPSERFLDIITRRVRGGAAGEKTGKKEDALFSRDDDDFLQCPPKGNAFKPSRKDRSIARALGKL
ncbi:MAG: NYN domain-containing protein [Nitrospirales bacterium]|nr:NYN domain-containing protein [Nitrospirales bacterium]